MTDYDYIIILKSVLNIFGALTITLAITYYILRTDKKIFFSKFFYYVFKIINYLTHV